MMAIDATGLRKSYGDHEVLAGVDLHVARGTVFALLGPNGAGKTTTVRILSTLLEPDAGRATVAGFDVSRERSQLRRSISLTGQYAAVDDELTGAENLRMMARLRCLSKRDSHARAAELLDRFDLTDAADRRLSTYSGGMRRRLDLAASLVTDVRVLFLDEPTTGLDPRSRQSMWQVITKLVDDGVTVFLTTQYLEEADALADTVAVIDHGRIVASGTPSELKERVGQIRLDITFATQPAFEAAQARLDALHTDAGERVLGVATDGSAVHIRQLLDEIDPDRRDVLRFKTHTATLDDVFLTLTGHAAAETKEPAHA